jgi:nicotinamide-nucleotide amidase
VRKKQGTMGLPGVAKSATANDEATLLRQGALEMLERLANEIIEHAKGGAMTVATAESCSAGRLAHALAKAEGASKHYLGGVVAYTKEMKERMLGVPPQLLQEGTAV